MDKNLYKVIIGAYIHDLGKMIRRGGENRKGKDYNVAHAQLTKEFFDNFPGFWKEIGLLASLHHAKDFEKYNYFSNEEDKFIAWCIYMADNLSAGERGERIDEGDYQEKENIKHIGLTCIFENIYKDKDIFGKNPTNAFQYIPETLDKASLIPVNKGLNKEGLFKDEIIKELNKKINSSNVKNGFQNLKEEFKEKFESFLKFYKDVNKDNVKEVIYKLDMLFQNYFTLIPSDAYKSIGDISLYDHTKTTVAFAVVLYYIFRNDFKNWKKYPMSKKDVENKQVKLITGDFPSIQSYIFGGIKKQKNIAKRLRARSLRVQLLNEAIVEYLLDKYNLPRANVLMNAGGKFVILANKDINIEKEKHNINSFLIKKYNGNVKFALTDKVYQLKDINQYGNVQDVFMELFDKLNKQKFKLYDEENLKQIFKYESVNGKNLCKYCGMNYFDVKENLDENDDNEKCENCAKEIELGKEIVKGKEKIYIQYKDAKGNFFYDEFFEKKDVNNSKHLAILFNSWDIDKLENDIGIPKSINLYIPKKDDKTSPVLKSFEEIASENNKYLCMVKGDIDSMSLIFKYGFGKTYSISRLMQFSRFLELFFGKYLHKYIEKNFPDVYTVFSGGDDFVFVIPFKDRKKFVKSLYNEFYKFVANNENIHFSVGVSIFKHKIPFKQVEKMTEELLKSSKNNAKEKMKSEVEKIDYNDGKIEKIKDDVLKYYGITYYDEDYTKVFEGEITNTLYLDPGIYNNLSSTARYKLYTVLTECLGYLEDKKMDKFVLNIGRLLYMIGRLDKKGKQNMGKKNILDDLKNKFGSINDVNKTKQDITDLLLKITDKIYEDRENI